MRALILVLAVALLGGCATLKNDTSVCPEYRNVRCMTGVICSMDSKRGCRVCYCSDADKPNQPMPDRNEQPSSQ